MPVSTSQIPGLLLPGVRKLKGDYAEVPAVWPKLFSSGNSEMQTERTLSMRYLPLPALKGQGQQTYFDQGAGQRYAYTHTHIAVGLGYVFTREALDDNLYKSAFNPTNLGLLKSFKQFKEIVAADVFNTGNTYNAANGGDGVALFSTAHPVDGYSVQNTPTNQIQLSESSLMLAANQIRRFRDNAGLQVGAQARLLLVPLELRHIAKRLSEAHLRPGTANNDIASMKENDDFRDGYIVNQYLTSPYAWFVLSDQGGFIHLSRTPFESSMHVDFTTDNLMVKGYERYYLGYDDWRAGWGTFPTN